jgi:hypothetical protein
MLAVLAFSAIVMESLVALALGLADLYRQHACPAACSQSRRHVLLEDAQVLSKCARWEHGAHRNMEGRALIGHTRNNELLLPESASWRHMVASCCLVIQRKAKLGNSIVGGKMIHERNTMAILWTE